MSYSRPQITGSGIFSSGGILTTTTNDEEWVVPNGKEGVNIMMEFLTDGAFQFDDLVPYAPFLEGDKFSVDGVGFSKLRFETAGTQVRFYGVFS